MPEMTRRRLLGSAGVTAGAALASLALPGNLRRAMAASGESASRGSLRDIKHIVILMQENRSFDHYFGTMAGVAGFDDPNAITLSTGRSVFYQPDPQNPDGYTLPFHLDTGTTSAQAIPSTSHAWSVQHSAWNGGKMDNWLPAHRAADGVNGPYTMGYYTRDDIPFQWALAENFTLCDHYHCSLMGPTWPNRLYLMSAGIDPAGTNGGPVISNADPVPFSWTTYPERLTAAGITWKAYQESDNYGTNVLEYFKQYQDAPTGSTLYKSAMTVDQHGRFEYDAVNDRLPTVSWILPTSYQSEHPDYLPAAGAAYVASKIDAIAANPDVWAKTLFILNYDENDGLFDHVVPPTPPAGTAGEFVDGLPIGGGFRVPCVLVSPLTMGGWVASRSYDHTSVLRLLETFTGVRETNITPWRRSAFGDLTTAIPRAGFGGDTSGTGFSDTAGQLALATYQAANLPAPALPGAGQTPPHQERGTRRSV